LIELDIDALLQARSDDAPCGPDLEYDPDFMALEQNMEGVPEKQIGDRIEPAQPPNWKVVTKDAIALLERTCDLRLILYITRAMLNLDGIQGFGKGIEFMEKAVSLHWDSIRPQLDPDDDNDPTVRVNLLLGLCDFVTVLNPLALAPLVQSRRLGRFSWRDMQIAAGKLAPVNKDAESPTPETLQGAFMDAELEDLQDTHRSLLACRENLATMEAFVTDRVGVGNAPSFAPLRDMLKAMALALNEQIQQRQGGEATESVGETDAGGEAEGGAKGGGGLGGIASRQDVIRALDLICAYYAKHEPSSPTPLLLQRAKRLVHMNFMEIMQDLAPEAVPHVTLTAERKDEYAE
jgi:type VI secretion system protein ImpA